MTKGPVGHPRSKASSCGDGAARELDLALAQVL